MFNKGDKVRIKKPMDGMNHYWVIFEMTPKEIKAEKQSMFDLQIEFGEPVEWSNIVVDGMRFLGTGYTEEQAISDVREWAHKGIAALTLNHVLKVIEADV